MQEINRSHASALMKDWPAIQTWRKGIRKDLITERIGIPLARRRAVNNTIVELIRDNFPELNRGTIGFYWPIKGEIDLRPLLQNLIAAGAGAALPVVVERNRPLEFWEWRGDTSMSRGIGNIPVPIERKPLQPTVLLIPLLGFDAAGHRLGYGGGYYDRTLAAFDVKPMTIGVGYDFGRLSTIYPQAHDIPFEAIVTEAACMRFDRR